MENDSDIILTPTVKPSWRRVGPAPKPKPQDPPKPPDSILVTIKSNAFKADNTSSTELPSSGANTNRVVKIEHGFIRSIQHTIRKNVQLPVRSLMDISTPKPKVEPQKLGKLSKQRETKSEEKVSTEKQMPVKELGRSWSSDDTRIEKKADKEDSDKRRRRPSMQIYQPPGRRREGISGLKPTKSCSRDLMEEEKRSEPSTTFQTSAKPPDPEVMMCGMPLKRTPATLNLTDMFNCKIRVPNSATRDTASKQQLVSQQDSALTDTNTSNSNSSCNTKELNIITAAMTDFSITPDAHKVEECLSLIAVTTNLHGSSSKTKTPFWYLHQMYCIDVNFPEVDAGSYPEWSQRYIFEAFHDPNLVTEEIRLEIGQVIAERAWTEEGTYHQVAARLIQRIAKKEYDNEEQVPQVQSLPFQRGVLDTCYRTFKRRVRFESQMRPCWRRYALFCSDLLRRLHFGAVPPTPLCQLVLNITDMFCTANHLKSVAEVETVVEILSRCGSQLEDENRSRLQRIVNTVVEHCAGSADPTITQNLALLKEMQANHWFLTAHRRTVYTG